MVRFIIHGRKPIKSNEFLHESEAALVSDILAYPLHTLWTVQQANSIEKTFSLGNTYYKIRQNGTARQTFYKGFSISALSCIPSTYFYLQGANCSIYLFGDNNVGQWMRGPFAQFFSTLINAPASLFIELKQASVGQPNKLENHFNTKSLPDQIKFILKENTLLGLYRGALPHLCIYSIIDALGFWFRENLLHCFPEKNRKEIKPQLFSTVFGFGFAYAALTPLSVVETRIRIHETNPQAFPDKQFFPAMKTLYKQRGLRGFFTGLPMAGLYGMVSYLPVACSGTYSR